MMTSKQIANVTRGWRRSLRETVAPSTEREWQRLARRAATAEEMVAKHGARETVAQILATWGA